MKTKFTAHCFWVAFFLVLLACYLQVQTPYARITLESSEQIRPGMTVQEASDIIGAPPGWFDGIWICGGLPGDDKIEDYPEWTEWTGINGAIVAEIDGSTIERVQFYPPASYHAGYRRYDLVFERMFRRRLESHPVLTSLGLIIAVTVTPTLIVLILLEQLHKDLPGFTVTAFAGLAIGYVCHCLGTGGWLRLADTRDFQIPTVAMLFFACLAIVILACVRAATWWLGHPASVSFEMSGRTKADR